jgi:ABC-2 type transport system permease protein
MKVFAIAGSNVRRMLRERSNIFFVFIFPIAIILLIGAQFGGGVDPRVGIVIGEGDELAEEIATSIEAADGIESARYESEDELTEAVERGGAQAGVFLPDGLTAAAASGETVEIGFIARPDGSGQQLLSVVNAAVADVMTPVGAAQFAAARTDASYETALEVARELAGVGGQLEVEVMTVGEALFPANMGQFDLGASSQLVLFVFLTAMTGAAALILSRQLGITQRMLSTPTSVGTVIAGESLGRLGQALVQGLYIMVLTLLIFQVDWGDPISAFVLLFVFAAVGAGAGMVMGSVFSNDQQAAGIGVVLSIGLAALGGCMVPIELFSPTMTTVAHFTPHAWALDGFAELLRRDGSVVDILTEVGVLALYAAALLGIASWRLRMVITRP